MNHADFTRRAAAMVARNDAEAEARARADLAELVEYLAAQGWHRAA